VTVGALSVTFILLELIMVAQRRLVPGMMMLGAFILLVLYLTGLIQTAILLFGPTDVSGNCQRYVTNDKTSGPTEDTLAWLQQSNICEYLSVLLILDWSCLTKYQVRVGTLRSPFGLLG
jgi:hypothetical protein